MDDISFFPPIKPVGFPWQKQQQYCTPPKFNISPLKNDGWKTILSYWEGNWGELLNFGRVYHITPPVFTPVLGQGQSTWTSRKSWWFLEALEPKMQPKWKCLLKLVRTQGHHFQVEMMQACLHPQMFSYTEIPLTAGQPVFAHIKERKRGRPAHTLKRRIPL